MNDARFKKLQSLWYRKIEKKGFVDIEKNGQLKVYSDTRLRYYRGHDETFHPTKNEAKEEYYRLAGEFLHVNRFESELERHIWEMHSEGMSVRRISEALAHLGIYLLYRTIHRRIQRLRRLMMTRRSSSR